METKKLSDRFSGKDRESMSNLGFNAMTLFMKLMDIVGGHSRKNFQSLGLKAGQTVIDYGCGPARYIGFASNAVGEKGKVFAVDIHPLAIAKVKEKIEKLSLTNVEAVFAENYTTPLNSETADVVYALDMFHMVEKPEDFLNELSRLVKKEGVIIIEDGHQPRTTTIQKIEQSGCLKIIQETKSHIKCQK
ncbi:class I SAM-dependent methyltransferase [uncultured Desulfobacter sp.]|uniref:class I SAM-dependent methyltransferase n=1 Tax=uncultured Desulfobacter sp. TaxID=240139 RepID=UPI0029F513BE|nr:class I SAM-dependent methyltransferase [uncultured Desulfobacter sp.]